MFLDRVKIFASAGAGGEGAEAVDVFGAESGGLADAGRAGAGVGGDVDSCGITRDGDRVVARPTWWRRVATTRWWGRVAATKRTLKGRVIQI